MAKEKKGDKKAQQSAATEKTPPILIKSPSKKKKTGPFQPGADSPIVGIGASAGGLDAFEKFFTHMPADSGIGFVLVQHLDPTHESILVELPFCRRWPII